MTSNAHSSGFCHLPTAELSNQNTARSVSKSVCPTLIKLFHHVKPDQNTTPAHEQLRLPAWPRGTVWSSGQQELGLKAVLLCLLARSHGGEIILFNILVFHHQPVGPAHRIWALIKQLQGLSQKKKKKCVTDCFPPNGRFIWESDSVLHLGEMVLLLFHWKCCEDKEYLTLCLCCLISRVCAH